MAPLAAGVVASVVRKALRTMANKKLKMGMCGEFKQNGLGGGFKYTMIIYIIYIYILYIYINYTHIISKHKT